MNWNSITNLNSETLQFYYIRIPMFEFHYVLEFPYILLCIVIPIHQTSLTYFMGQNLLHIRLCKHENSIMYQNSNMSEFHYILELWYIKIRLWIETLLYIGILICQNFDNFGMSDILICWKIQYVSNFSVLKFE